MEGKELALTLKLVSDQFTSGLVGARKTLKDFGAYIAQMAAPLAGVGVAMGAVVAKAANFGDQLNKTSQKIGVGVEDLAKLQYAAKLADVSNDQLATGLAKLAKNMVAAADGTGPAHEAFEKLGVSVVDSNGKVRSAGDVMADLAEKFAAMKDGAEKTAFSIEFFGKAGKDLIPLMNSGKEGLAAAAVEAKNLGVVLSDNSAKAAEEFNDNMTRLGTLFEGLVVQLGAALIPALNGMAEAIKPVIIAISQWAQAHPELMEGLVAMAGVLGSGGAVAVAAAAFGTLLAGMAAVGGPILLWSAGISAVVGVLVGFRKEIAAAIESVKRFLDDGLGAADRFISTMVDGLQRKLAPFAKVAEAIAGTVAKFLKPGSPTEEGPWSDLDKWGERFGDTLAEGMTRGTSKVTDAAKGIAADAKTAFGRESVASNVQNRLANDLDIRGTIPTRNDQGQFSTSVSRTGTTFSDGMAESFRAFSDRAKDSFAQGVMFADTAARAMANAFETFFFNALEGKIHSLKDVFNGLLDITKAFVSAVIKELIRIAAVKFIGAAFGSLGANAGGEVVKAAQGGQVLRYALGGPVPGIGNQDTVPALLTPGEYVLSRRDVSDIKRGLGGGNTIVNNITINAGADQRDSSTGAAPNWMQMARELGKIVEAKLIEEQRPGGLLAGGRA